MLPSATTRLFALLGDPVAHSLSPRFHNAALRHFGIDAVYVALRCDAASVRSRSCARSPAPAAAAA
jgi:shikimate 5-dehydrogenase